MRRPFEMFHESICALKRIGRQMAMWQIKPAGRNEKRAEDGSVSILARTILYVNVFY
ncbi:hypothetical protein [Pseudomonas sp. Kh13]|uniref:hypothetical protein n=1 Tax=Pseudomonas sp. Kh13 TaxID=2093744 RepID=UPI0015B62213|nr:hypothetical protein [Pseudomonas sp. Kh13]